MFVSFLFLAIEKEKKQNLVTIRDAILHEIEISAKEGKKEKHATLRGLLEQALVKGMIQSMNYFTNKKISEVPIYVNVYVFFRPYRSEQFTLNENKL